MFCKASRRGDFRAIRSRKEAGDRRSQAAEAPSWVPSFSSILHMGELRLMQEGSRQSCHVCSDKARWRFLPSLSTQELPFNFTFTGRHTEQRAISVGCSIQQLISQCGRLVPMGWVLHCPWLLIHVGVRARGDTDVLPDTCIKATASPHRPGGPEKSQWLIVSGVASLSWPLGTSHQYRTETSHAT